MTRLFPPHAFALALGLALVAPDLAAQTPQILRVVQTNSAGMEAHVIDPADNRVVGVIDVPKPHGVAVNPEGTRYFITNEADEAVDVIDTKSLQRLDRIPLSSTPHNIAISNRSRRAYVAIITRGIVDVIDIDSHELVRSIPTPGGVHNTFVTPDHRFVVAGMIGARALTVIDTSTDEPVWTLRFEATRPGSGLDTGGVRPITFETHPDGSTKRMFVQISGHHGFYVVDWESQEIVDKVSPPPLPLSQQTSDGIQGAPSHGSVVTPDGTQIWISSRVGSRVYAWSLPDLQYLGYVRTGSPSWLTATPDSRFVYVAVANTNETVVVDTRAMEVVTRIPVGQTPKRLAAVMIAEPEFADDSDD
jgi:YVTN family beta-propeller protein